MKIDFRKYGYFLWCIIICAVAPTLADETGAPDPNFGQFFIAGRKEVAIDGNLDEWQTQTPVFLNQKEQAKYSKEDWNGPTDCSVKFWIGWNDDGFIIGAETIDDSVAFPFNSHKGWSNDCIQFCVDVHDDNDQSYYANDDHEFVVTMNDTLPTVYEHSYSELRESGYRDFPCQVIVAGDTIRYEVLIPWAGLGIIGPFAGMHLGVSLVAFDNDGANFRGWMEWTAGIANKKFTLPYANVLLFDEKANIVQAIPTQSFLSVSDSLVIWTYTRYYRRSVSYRLFENDETLFREKTPVRGKQWKRMIIAPKYLKWGTLKLEINSTRISRHFDIAIWSKERITEQISYLVQQVSVLKNLKGIDASVNNLMKYWVDWLQSKFVSAETDFDYFDVMNQAQKRIEQIPNFFMKKQVFYHREYRIVERMYFSENENTMRRYLLYLPREFDPKENYPAFVFLHDYQKNEEESAREIGEILVEMDRNIIGVFPRGYPQFGLSRVSLQEIKFCLDDVEKKFPIDTQKLYLAGEGLGGHEALLLALQSPDRFAAITLVDSKIDTSLVNQNIRFTPVWIFGENKNEVTNHYVIHKINKFRGKAGIRTVSEQDIKNAHEIFTRNYFSWLLTQKKDSRPIKVDFTLDQLHPSKVAWLEVQAQKNYYNPASIDAVVDSHRIVVTTKNIQTIAIHADQLPATIKFPFEVIIDASPAIQFHEETSTLVFQKREKEWAQKEDAVIAMQKTRQLIGPLSNVFSSPIKYVFSSAHDSANYNQLTRKLVREASRRGPNVFLKDQVVADTSIVKQQVNSNLFIVGSSEANVLFEKIANKMPMVETEQGIKFGDSHFSGMDKAAFFIYPNPMNPDFLVMVCLAPAVRGLQNIEKLFDLHYFNRIYEYDYLIVEDGVSKQNSYHWVDFGYFDENWGTPWFQPKLRKGPKNWLANILLGMDANQLSINSNWSGGGKGSFTWKVYSKFEFEYKKKQYNWKNILYCAYGQISVQEKEQWTVPQKSNDVIDFDSELKFTLERFIDPYIAFAFDTQFSAGYHPKTKELVSRFANPVKLSQSAGIAKSLSKKKKFKLTTRLGYGAQEVVAEDVSLRKLWTGNETKWMKIDGGVEWLTESKSEFNSSITWTNKLKLFQAIFSSISEENDPDKNWRQLDIYWEQMFTAKLTQYVLFNVVMKFKYDRDTSKGGQFLENASLGVSYKFKGIAL